MCLYNREKKRNVHQPKLHVDEKSDSKSQITVQQDTAM
jgi:hypothetical protein